VAGDGRGADNLALSLARLARLEDSTQVYQEIARQFPNDATAHSDLGFVHLIELSSAAMERDGAAHKINTRAAKNL